MNEPILFGLLGALAMVLLLRLIEPLQGWLLGPTEPSPSEPRRPVAQPTEPRKPEPRLPDAPLPSGLESRPAVRLLLQALITAASLTPNRLDDLAADWAKRILEASRPTGESDPEGRRSADS